MQVRDPETSGGFRKYTTYRITTSPWGTIVRRRFSDFLWLRTTLSARYVGILLPILPEKKAFGNSGEEFVQSRMRALSTFMTRLIENPYLKKDVTLKQFLSVQEAKAWENAKRDASNTKESDNEGEMRWRAAINRYPLPANAERLLVDMSSQLDLMERALKEVCGAARRLADRAKAFSFELGSFRAAWSELERAEALSADPRAVEHTTAAAANLSDVMGRTGQALHAWSQISSFEGVMIETLVYEVRSYHPHTRAGKPAISHTVLQIFKYEVGQIGALKEMIRSRDDMLAASAKAQRTLEKHDAELGVLTSSGAREDKVVKQTQLVEADKVAKQRCDYVVEFMTKGLFFSEIDRFSTEKLQMILEMFGTLGVSGQALSGRLSTLWGTVMTQLQVDPTVSGSRNGSCTHVSHVLAGRRRWPQRRRRTWRCSPTLR